MERPITVHDFEVFGNMVKRWAKQPATRPRDLADLKQQLQQQAEAALRPIATVSKTVTELVLVPHDLHQLVIKLAPAVLIEASEALFETDAVYPLPAFYGSVDAPGAQEGATKEQKLTFHAQRIGDYTIGNCA